MLVKLLPLLLFGSLAACAGHGQTPAARPSDPRASSLVAQGEGLLAQSDFEGAIAAYEQAIDEDPSFSPAYSHLAYAHLFDPQTRKAGIEEARRATEMAPGSAEAWAYLARAYDWNGRFDDALEAGERALRLNPKNAIVQSFLGGIYADLRMYDKALRAGENAIRLDPNSAEALAEYQTALDLQPDFVHRRSSIAANYLYRLDDENAAREQIDQAQALAPDDYITLLLAARQSSRTGEVQAAIAYCQRILEIAPNAPDGHACLGGVYRDAGEYTIALREWRTAIQVDPDDENGYLGLGCTYVAIGDCLQAVDQFLQAVALHPRSGDNHAALGFGYACSGESQQAKGTYK